MNFRLALLLWLVNYAAAQDANCDFYQKVEVGRTYSVYNPNYPYYYSGGVQCRWTAVCPSGYNCRLDCPEISMPQTTSCSLDRLLISRTGDSQLAAAETYCGRGSLSNIVSTGEKMVIGLITNRSSPGGRFVCNLQAQASTPTQQCRCGEKRQTRIVGGVETGVNEYPMMVGIAELAISQIKFEGVLISDRAVLTAAHCVRNRAANEFAVIVGEHNVTVGDSPATRAYAIRNFKIHELYSESNYDNDIALVMTVLPIEFNDRVLPACLPFKFRNKDFTGDKVTILGWGTQFPGGPSSNVPMKVDLTVVSQSTCRTQIASVTDRQMCTYAPGKDACQDDSGGPVLYTDPATARLFNVGIISYGIFCASSTPGINTRVTAFLEWIEANSPYNYCVK